MKKRSIFGLWTVCWLLAVCGALLIATGFALEAYLNRQIPSKPAIPWLCAAYVWGFAAIFFPALARFARVVKNIALDRSVTTENAVPMRAISSLAFLAGVWSAVGVALSAILPLPSPAIIRVCGAVLAVVCVIVGILARALSKLTARAAEIKAENDLTV